MYSPFFSNPVDDWCLSFIKDFRALVPIWPSSMIASSPMRLLLFFLDVSCYSWELESSKLLTEEKTFTLSSDSWGVLPVSSSSCTLISFDPRCLARFCTLLLSSSERKDSAFWISFRFLPVYFESESLTTLDRSLSDYPQRYKLFSSYTITGSC